MAIVEFIQANTIISLAIISALVTFFITLVTYFVTDKEKMKELKARQKELQKKAKEHQKNGNQDALLEVNKQMLQEMQQQVEK